MGRGIIGAENSAEKQPRTARGRKTLRKLLDAATVEFGEKGFHDASISGITRRAEVALGSFYTYFDSKDAIFRALVADMSNSVKTAARDAIAGASTAIEVERDALKGFLDFAAKHKEVYRIIDEAEFVDPSSYRNHYETIADRIFLRLQEGAKKGEFRQDPHEAHAWAIMGMNVFLGLRYAIWGEQQDWSSAEIAKAANDLLARGILDDS